MSIPNLECQLSLRYKLEVHGGGASNCRCTGKIATEKSHE
jgi:hypothetical protein